MPLPNQYFILQKSCTYLDYKSVTCMQFSGQYDNRLFPPLFSRRICVSWNDHFAAMELFHFLDQFLGLQISQRERNSEDQWLNCKNRFAKRVHLLPIHL